MNEEHNEAFLLTRKLEYYKKINAILMKINKITDKEAYLIKELSKYQSLIEELKTLNLYEQDIDYDWDENPIENYWPATLDDYIENFFSYYEDKPEKQHIKK